jgi:hypothetical protein
VTNRSSIDEAIPTTIYAGTTGPRSFHDIAAGADRMVATGECDKPFETGELSLILLITHFDALASRRPPSATRSL